MTAPYPQPDRDPQFNTGWTSPAEPTQPISYAEAGPAEAPAKRRRKWPWILLGVGVLALLLCIGAASLLSNPPDAPKVPAPFATTLSAEPSPTSVTPRAARPAVPAIEDGTWVVGTDVPAGTYKVNQPIKGDAICYWAIYKSGTNGSEIIANGTPTGGRPEVVLKKGQDFNTERCGTWTKIR